MDKIFGSRLIRNKFILSILVIFILFLIIRYFVLPNYKSLASENFSSFIDKFIISVFTSVLVGYFLYLLQLEEKKKEVEFTESGPEVEKYLSQARTKTENWHFNGGLGRYTKSSTIPRLSKIASAERRTIAIELIVINPFNKALINNYIDFRKSVETNNSKCWTELDVQAEILSTIITALYNKRINQMLKTSLYIKDFFTLSRMDISSSVAVITREDPKIPSIIAKNGTHTYKHYMEEFQQVLRQSKILNYTFLGTEQPTKEVIIECLQSLFPGEEISEGVIENTYKKFKNPENPFA